MTNLYPGLARGPIDHNASSVINSISGGAIEMGDVVVIEKPATGPDIPPSELLARVVTGTLATQTAYAIAVGGDADGVYSSTGSKTGAAANAATTTAGQGVVILTQGRCVAFVTVAGVMGVGQTLKIGAGGVLIPTTGSGVEHTFAHALQEITAAGTHLIAVDVQREGNLN